MTVIATPEGVRHEHVVVPLAGADAGADAADDGVARLGFDNGLGRLDMRADRDLEELLDAQFTAPLPTVWISGHATHVVYPLGARLLRRMRPNRIRINPRLPWSIDVHGGAEHLAADLTGVDLRSLAVHSGAAHVRLLLGRPCGRRTIRLRSVRDLRMDRPGDVPVRIEIAGGCTEVTLDDRRFGAVGRGLAEETPGYGGAGERYLLVVSGGAAGVTVSSSR